MRIDRRRALGLLGAGVARPAAAETSKAGAAPGGFAPSAFAPSAFDWGVASGDPLQDRVILWTRCDSGGRAVLWEIAEDAGFEHVAANGQVTPGAARDFTLKVDAGGLKPGRDYWYRFRVAGGAASPVGRTRTLPVGALKDVVLAVTTCSLYPNGYFNAYGAIAVLPRVDAVLHLGDYIYEYGGAGSYGMSSAVAGERPHDPPHECVTLADYRRRHAQYKTDPQLQAAHARAPWIVVWDDHETANDSWTGGAENHQPATEGDWNVRKAAAIKAYYEWMPIREPTGGGFAIWRSFDFGDVASLFMFETRLTARDKQVTYAADLPMPPSAADLAAFEAKRNDPARKMMSKGQEDWLAAGLAASVRSGRPWQVLGNQVVMAQITTPSLREAVGPAAFDATVPKLSPYVAEELRTREVVAAKSLPYLLDSWDGYPVDRLRLYGLFEQAKANCIVLSGDSHAFWANELYDAPTGGRLAAVEFGTTGITSPATATTCRACRWASCSCAATGRSDFATSRPRASCC